MIAEERQLFFLFSFLMLAGTGASFASGAFQTGSTPSGGVLKADSLLQHPLGPSGGHSALPLEHQVRNNPCLNCRTCCSALCWLCPSSTFRCTSHDAHQG